MPKPNLVFIMTDQLRPDALGCYGSAEAITPHIDTLARKGVRFDNFYVQNPLCCPSRYSILTGRYPHCHGVVSNWYAPRPGETSFAHQLNRAGYQTAAIGKMHLTPWHDRFGFDGRIIAEAKFHTTLKDDYEFFLNRHGTSRQELYDFQSKDYIQNCTAVPCRVPQELHIDSFVGRAACEYLRRTQSPFCLMVSFLGPHNPYDPPEPYRQLFENKRLPARNMTAGEIHHKPMEAYHYINQVLNWPFRTDELTPDQIQIMKQHYYACTTHIDDWVGRIVATLQATGQYENTVIVVTSDHGDLLGDHGLVYKQCFYEQSVRAPLIFHAPHRFTPGTSAALVESLDLLSTFCELGAAWPGAGRQGRSLVNLLENPTNREFFREAAFSENYFGRMVRYQNFKMVYYPGKPYGELYDLAADSLERENLWDQLEGSREKLLMKDLLLEWAFASENQLPLPVRPGHHDYTPRHTHPEAGQAVFSAHQEWQIDHLADIYRDWDFSEDGVLRM